MWNALTRPPPVIDEFGDTRWVNKLGQKHRADGPAAMYNDGTELYFLNGKMMPKHEFYFRKWIRKLFNGNIRN